jgi:hypothetical protein
MWHYWCSIIFFTFPSFPKFHRVVPLLQTCSTSEFVYDHIYFCVCLSLDLSSTYERKHEFLCFWSWLTSLNIMSSSCIHLPSNPMSLFLMAD